MSKSNPTLTEALRHDRQAREAKAAGHWLVKRRNPSNGFYYWEAETYHEKMDRLSPLPQGLEYVRNPAYEASYWVPSRSQRAGIEHPEEWTR